MTCMTGSTFAYASAQAVCAVSVCSEASSHSNIAMILDAGLLLASIIILPMIILVHHFPICRIPVQRPVSLSILAELMATYEVDLRIAQAPRKSKAFPDFCQNLEKFSSPRHTPVRQTSGVRVKMGWARRFRLAYRRFARGAVCS